MSKSKAVEQSLTSKGATIVQRLRHDAKVLMARGRAEVLKDLRAVQRSTDRAVRDLERKIVRQLHAATSEQMKRLERRVAKLERLLAERPGGDIGRVA